MPWPLSALLQPPPTTTADCRRSLKQELVLAEKLETFGSQQQPLFAHAARLLRNVERAGGAAHHHTQVARFRGHHLA